MSPAGTRMAPMTRSLAVLSFSWSPVLKSSSTVTVMTSQYSATSCGSARPRDCTPTCARRRARSVAQASPTAPCGGMAASAA
eukprot:11907579-Heterocapsa_arctica.AAC.1